MQLLFWNRWNQESSGRVYFKISREKPSHTPDTPHVQPLSCKLEWSNQITLHYFLLKPFRDNLAPAFPRALDLSPWHAQKTSGSRLRNSMQPKLVSIGMLVSLRTQELYDKEKWCQFATLQNPCIDLKLVRGSIGSQNSITCVLLARNKNICSLW